jgi:hypothetical protein
LDPGRTDGTSRHSSTIASRSSGSWEDLLDQAASIAALDFSLFRQAAHALPGSFLFALREKMTRGRRVSAAGVA